MKRIGLLSDTHNHIDQKFLEFLKDCDMIIHAGDIGSVALADTLAAYKPLIAVSGNIDDYDTRLVYPMVQRFKVEDVNFLMTHIGGYPGKYSADSRKLFTEQHPDVFICGHSHILRVMYDQKNDFLLMNPGAAGQYGQQPKRTALRFVVEGKEICDLEICELPR
ncbi:MAG: metallophosphatase family protein [Bacteroidales bacterium]|nr:metallophosphatase family protein [Bacteroidales bacterium]